MEIPVWPVKVKKCSSCGVEKEYINFYPHKYTKDKLRAKCKQCTASENKQWAGENLHKIKDAYYKRTYGMSYENVLEKHKSVDNRCEVCLETKKLLAVDHCHSSGNVRGLLCMRCNLLLGKVEENKGIILKLFKYLDERK